MVYHLRLHAPAVSCGQLALVSISPLSRNRAISFSCKAFNICPPISKKQKAAEYKLNGSTAQTISIISCALLNRYHSFDSLVPAYLAAPCAACSVFRLALASHQHAASARLDRVNLLAALRAAKPCFAIYCFEHVIPP